MNSRTFTLTLESLEGRALPSFSSWGGGILGGLWNPSSAVQADLAKIQTDTQALHTEMVALAPTLQKDQQAIQTAVQNAIDNDASVQTAQATLKSAESTWAATIESDWSAIAAASSSTERSAAFQQLKTDLKAAHTAISADVSAVHTAIDADTAVAAAQAQLKTDSAPITADKATLQADYQQLEKDLAASSSSSTTVNSARAWGW